MCDALSTAVYVMGLEKASEYWKESGGFDMLLVTDGGEIYLTEGIADDFTLNENVSDREVQIIRK